MAWEKTAPGGGRGKESSFCCRPYGGRSARSAVVVDQPGDDGATIEVHHAREWPLVLLDLGVAANRQDALALDRQRLSNREPVVHGDDLAAQQHDIRWRLRRGSFAADDSDGSNEKGTYDGAHHGFL